MYIRDAKKREEVWLLDNLDSFGFEDPAFRSRDYVIALDPDAGRKVGFGRLRVHGGDEEFCELTCIGVLEEWRNRGVGAHIVERLVDLAREQEFDEVVAFTGETGYFEQFGFETVDPESLTDTQTERLAVIRETMDPEAVPLVAEVGRVTIPRRLRHRFVPDETEAEERPEDFGIDPDTATYKYDTGRH